jgi:hypothetical protein
MDIFSDEGVCKACLAMAEVTYGSGATPTDVPRWMVDTTDSGGTRGYIAVGTKILESTDGSTWNLFRTNGQGVNLGLAIWAGYVIYISETKIGRTLVGDASLANDSYLTTLDQDQTFHPALVQAGTLKIGAARYVASLDESFTFTPRALKLPSDYRVRCLADYLGNLMIGTRMGPGNVTGAVLNQGSDAFAWKGTVLSSGSALPDNAYPMKLRGMNAFLVDGQRLYAFPDGQGDILIFDGAGFPTFRTISPIKKSSGLTVSPGAVTQHVDNSILFAGDTSQIPGVYQMKNGAVCQAFVPSTVTPGGDASINIGFVKTSFNGVVTIGYYEGGTSSYHIQRTSANRQNNAMMRTCWHRVGTDRFKRWAGIRLNLKPMAAGTVVTVAYRTGRDESFTNMPHTITSANQNRPVLFSVRPRSREIQFRFTFTTSTNTTPQLISYDPIFETLTATR